MSVTGHQRPAVAFVLSVFVLALLGVRVWEDVRTTDRRIGITLEEGSNGVLVWDLEPESPADRAGLQAGDEIVAIGASGVVTLDDYDRHAGKFRRGEVIRFDILRTTPSGAASVQRFPAEIAPGMPIPWLEIAVSLLAALGHLVVAILALFGSSRDRRARLLFFFSSAVAVNLALPLGVIGQPTLLTLYFAVYYLLSGLEIGLELHLASMIPRRAPWLESRPWIVSAYYASGMGLGVLACVTLISEDLLNLDWFPWSTLQTEMLLIDFGLPVWATAVAVILWLQATRAPSRDGRTQAGLVLAGVIPWTAFVLWSTGMSLAGRDTTSFFLIESFVLLCYPVAVLVAIFRYRLFDIERVVRRGLTYTLLTAALVLLFYGAVGLGGLALSEVVGSDRPSIWLVSAATLLIGMLFAPLRAMLKRLVDRRFFPERNVLRGRLIALASELPAQGKLPLMGRVLIERLTTIFGVRSATLLIGDPKAAVYTALASSEIKPGDFDEGFLISSSDPALRRLESAGRPMTSRSLAGISDDFGERLRNLNAEIVVPLMRRDSMIGVLALGAKRTGEDYLGEERELLNLLGRHVAEVFENARLFESATYESLTGLLRREAILERLEQELVRALRYNRPLTVALADLDHFKDVNDRHGHLVGDNLLKRVAQVIRLALRSTDLVGRYGGEEFLVVLPETAFDDARLVAEKVRRLVGVARVAAGAESVGVTVSIGVVSLGDKALPPNPTVRDLIAAADEALYSAKQSGRDRVFPKLPAESDGSVESGGEGSLVTN